MQAAGGVEVIRAGRLEVRPGETIALAGGRPLTLSVREFDLLVALARRLDRIVSREQLFELVWGGALRAGDRSVDVYVHKVRIKLEDALPGWRFIHTHVGFGYRLSPEPFTSFSQRGHSRVTESRRPPGMLAAVWQPDEGDA